MAYETRALANCLLDLSDNLRLPLTHMALHKVAYFAHGWRLAQTGMPLVSEEFEAWEHGPVLPTVYAAFKGVGRMPISSRAERLDPTTQCRVIATADFPDSDVRFFQDIVRAYGPLSALTLSDITHRPGGAWDAVWNARAGKVTLGMRIRNEAIRAEFLGAGLANKTDRRGFAA